MLMVWLALMLLPFATFKLAQDRQFQVFNTRVFLISERGLGGIGFQSTRDAEPAAICQQTRINYLMWEGEPANTLSCSCADGVERVPDGRSCVEP